MSDSAAKLRWLADLGVSVVELNEAADEIDRLRAELDTTKRCLFQAQEAAKQLVAELDALQGLRSVLQDAVEWCDRYDYEPHWLALAMEALAAPVATPAPVAQKVPDADAIREAIQSAWCHPKNLKTPMDADIVDAAVSEVIALLAAAQAQPKGGG